MSNRSVPVAYGIWCLCFIGVCGGQRFYAGKVGSGLVYLFTFGWLGIGQFIDLFLIPEMIGGSGSGMTMAHANASQTINLNLGDLKEHLGSPREASGEVQTHLQKLLIAANKTVGSYPLLK